MVNNVLTLSAQEFQELRDFVYKSIGVNLTEAKRSLVISRLSKHIRKKGLTSFSEYLLDVKMDSKEKEVLFNLITTNVTKFFRESHHFDYLINYYIPTFKQGDTIRIWSSACSSGEEPYSIAMTMEKGIKTSKRLNYKILASDINTEMLSKAKSGIYTFEEVEGVPYDELKRYFKLGQQSNKGLFKVKDRLREKITFKRINLVSSRPLPLNDKVHIIFCRNVFIYFNKETQRNILDRFYEQLHPGGVLILGHSESIPTAQHKWRLIQKTIYERID